METEWSDLAFVASSPTWRQLTILDKQGTVAKAIQNKKKNALGMCAKVKECPDAEKVTEAKEVN